MRQSNLAMAFGMLINLANGKVLKRGSGAYKQASDPCEGIKK